MMTSDTITGKHFSTRAWSAAVGLMLLAAGGCSDNATPAGQLATGPIPPEKATLTVWTFLPSNYEGGPEAYKGLLADFQAAYPQITVNLVDMPYGTYFDQVRNAVVAQNGPDVITMYGAAQAYSYKNGLFPLQDAIAKDLGGKLKFVDENYSVDGNLYIVPTGTYGYVMLVNQSIFAKAGIDPIKGMESWPAMLATCKALSQQGIQPMASGWKDGFLLETYLYMITSQLMDKPTLTKWVHGDLQLDDKLFAEAVDYIVQMKDAGCFGDDKALGRNMYDDTSNQYMSGGAAMVVSGTMGAARHASTQQPTTTVVPLPQVPSSAHKSLIDAGAEAGWSVTKWTKNPQAAVTFVNFLAGQKVQAKLWEEIGVPPNLGDFKPQTTDALQAAYLAQIMNPENHTGFAAFPLPVLAVVERNAVPLMGGTMT
ncbi:MAG: extracellular solute-binding protein, partial [Mesorhizobium sp.]